MVNNSNRLYGINVCGEGGEYETLTLDCPLFEVSGLSLCIILLLYVIFVLILKVISDVLIYMEFKSPTAVFNVAVIHLMFLLGQVKIMLVFAFYQWL